jgi:hypothetical protein
MVSSGMLHRVALVSSSETTVLTRATRPNIPEDTIPHSHRRENLKSYRLEVFVNRMLRRIFGPKRDGVTGRCSGLHNEGFHSLYSSPRTIIMIKARTTR